MADVRVSLTRQSLLVSGACLAVDLFSFLSGDGPRGGVLWFAVLVAVVLVDAALATPARYAGAVAVAAAAVSAAGVFALGGPAAPDVLEAGGMIAAFRAGAALRGRRSGLVLAVLIGLVLVLGVARGHPLGWLVLLEVVRIVVLPWLVGRYTNDRRAYLDDLVRQADHARRDAREAVDRAIAEDRGAIARDLHDVISHHVSAINVHAGAARLRLPATAGATESLKLVESASRAALTDLREMLNLLHGERPGEERQPGLGNIDELLTGFRAAGLPVVLRTEGEPRPVDGPADIALYRIAQEMLTNALRHGNGDPIEVTLRYGDDRFELVTLNGVDPGGIGSGGRDSGGRDLGGREVGGSDRPRRGLTGIRERARTFDGETHSGPEPGGRAWRTSVSLTWAGR